VEKDYLIMGKEERMIGNENESTTPAFFVLFECSLHRLSKPGILVTNS
jgi:hypothetical protein